MIDPRERIFTSTQGDIDFIALPNLSHITAHLPAGLVSAGATKMMFKSRTMTFEGNETPLEALLYDYSGPTSVEIDLVDVAANIVLPDEVGKSPGFIPVLTNNAGVPIDFGGVSFAIYFSIKTELPY